MDPQFLARLNALQNYQNQESNQANLEQLQANEEELRANANAAQENASELRKLRQQLNEEANKPQCPHCGGPSEKGFERCKNCGQEVIWCGHFVGKPGQGQQLAIAMQQHQIAEQEKHRFQRRSQHEQELSFKTMVDKVRLENIRKARVENIRKDIGAQSGGCLVIACIVILSLVIVVSYSPMLLN